MLLCQISDLHLGLRADGSPDGNLDRLHHVIERVNALDPRPDVTLISGDLADAGDLATYRILREALRALIGPVLLLAGNHDRRAPLLQVFPDTPLSNGFIQYARDWDEHRLVVLDTLDEGRGAGAFCATRADWLAACLAQRPDTPTVVALHHPPIAVGIDWMDPSPAASWIERLRAVIVGAPQIIALIAGHLHRPIVGSWAGRPCVVASSVAPQLAFELRPTPTAHPDGRALIIREPPAFVLHRWTPSGLISHFLRAEAAPVLVRLDGHSAPAIAACLREHAAS